MKIAELALASLVLFGCGWPLLAQAARSLRAGRFDRSVLFSAAALLAYLYGVLAIAAPGWFPAELRRVDVGVAPHFEASALAAAIGIGLQPRRE